MSENENLRFYAWITVARRIRREYVPGFSLAELRDDVDTALPKLKRQRLRVRLRRAAAIGFACAVVLAGFLVRIPAPPGTARQHPPSEPHPPVNLWQYAFLATTGGSEDIETSFRLASGTRRKPTRSISPTSSSTS